MIDTVFVVILAGIAGWISGTIVGKIHRGGK